MATNRPLKVENAPTADKLRDALGEVVATCPGLPVFVKNKRTGIMLHITNVTQRKYGTIEAVIIEIGR